jgi:hypothetical protein
MSSVTVRPGVSGNWAYLWGFRRFCGMRLSVAYRPVPARLQYGCSTARSSQVDEGAKEQCCSAPSVAKIGLVNSMRDVLTSRT